jgi:hypothetical protein
MTEQTEFAGVRLARPGDEDAVYDLLLGLYSENALFTLSEHKARATIRYATEKRGGIIGVIDGPKGLEATVGLALETYWYTDQWHLSEYWNYVSPEFRQSNHAKRLIDYSKWMADRLGVPLIMGILTTSHLAPKMRLYQRQLDQIGAFFHHGLSISGTYPQRKAKRRTDYKDQEYHKEVVIRS